MEKITKTLIKNNMCDGSFFVYCTKWNASIGQQIITVYGDDMFITPVTNGIYGVNIEKAVKISRFDVGDIKVDNNFWTGIKIIITLKSGKKLKYRLVNDSWIKPANMLKDVWLNGLKIVKKMMTVEEAFLLDCRVTAKQLIESKESFTISQLVHKVVNDESDAKEWIRIDGEKIYNTLKQDIKDGKLNAKIVLVKRGEEIIYGKIRFANKES